jgi:hypothetical protein
LRPAIVSARSKFEERVVRIRPRAKAVALATENAAISPFLPLAAALIITLFTISLAMAEPRSDMPVFAAHDATFGMGTDNGGLASDALPAGAVILTRPLYPPRHPDRYEFYHRYDYGLTSRYRPNEEGAR